MNYEFFTLTDIGCVRANNEDAAIGDGTLGLGLLADGMGGYNAGEVASQMAVSLIHADLGNWLGRHTPGAQVPDIRRALEACVSKANRAIHGAAQANPAYAGMGTTLVAGVFQGARLVLGHVGDSRCYRWRHGQLTQITRDHSLLQEQLDAGLISAAEAAHSPNRNLVTRAMGVEGSVAPEIRDFTVSPGDIYLMCSDGLSDLVDDRDIAGVLAAGAPLADSAGQLVRQAIAQGGHDNVTVLLIQAHDDNRAPGGLSRWLGI
jgi:PPM family protein phosphatase